MARPEAKEMLASAKGQACICCGINDGTIVAAHYQGFRSHSLGKGTGIKPHNLFIAHLCSKCHAVFDSYDSSNFPDLFMRKIDRSEAFLYMIVKTWERLFNQGKITINK